MTIETALASTLSITSENSKELTVYIQAEGSLSEDFHYLEVVIPANTKNFVVNITPKDMGGKAFFFVRGKTNPVTPRGTCSNLSIDKNYLVNFSNLNVGTECKSQLDSGTEATKEKE
ncbi:MAG: hypothetical protein K2W94_06260 [Alphaproteobacteria bacterium]|nr:hypothetical protein [Alphaproteobacteria bacterium]